MLLPCGYPLIFLSSTKVITLRLLSSPDIHFIAWTLLFYPLIDSVRFEYLFIDVLRIRSGPKLGSGWEQAGREKKGKMKVVKSEFYAFPHWFGPKREIFSISIMNEANLSHKVLSVFNNLKVSLRRHFNLWLSTHPTRWQEKAPASHAPSAPTQIQICSTRKPFTNHLLCLQWPLEDITFSVAVRFIEQSTWDFSGCCRYFEKDILYLIGLLPQRISNFEVGHEPVFSVSCRLEFTSIRIAWGMDFVNFEELKKVWGKV